MNLKTTTLAAVTASAAIAPQAAGAPSSPAPAAAPTPKHARQYLRAYRAVARKFGHRAPGRNIVRWGLRGRKATDRDLTRSLTVLHRMLAPPRPSSAVSAGVRAVSNAVSTGVATLSAGAAGVPACASESGSNYSTGPSNTNPSGATGRYQIMPFHWSTDCKGLDTSPAGQDACAAIIYRNSGAGAWVGCGG